MSGKDAMTRYFSDDDLMRDLSDDELERIGRELPDNDSKNEA